MDRNDHGLPEGITPYGSEGSGCYRHLTVGCFNVHELAVKLTSTSGVSYYAGTTRQEHASLIELALCVKPLEEWFT